MINFRSIDRYTVIKVSDVSDALSPDECTTLIELEDKVSLSRERNGKPPLKCVVVEADWPEYEPTWQAIERRVTGKEAPRILPVICEGMEVKLEELGWSETSEKYWIHPDFPGSLFDWEGAILKASAGIPF